MANYDHASYLTRQMEFFGKTTAGANGTSFVQSFPTGMRIRRATAVVATAGTSTGAAINLISLTGTATTTIGSLALSTSAANTVVQGSDFNSYVPSGSLFYFTNGTDATSVASIMVEQHLDPQFGLFSNP